jgi:hypothetical protein
MNANALKPPRTAWTVEAALWRAIEDSRTSPHGIGYSEACAASGSVIVSIRHDRKAVPAFSFWRGVEEVTDSFRKALRGSVQLEGMA